MWHKSEKTGWCDIHQRIRSCVIYIGEFWAVWHTSEKTGWYDIHWRILGCVTYIGENWIVWHTLEKSELCDILSERRRNSWNFSVPLSWNTIKEMNKLSVIKMMRWRPFTLNSLSQFSHHWPSTFISTPLGYFQFKHHVLTDRRTDKQNVDDLKSELWRNKSEHVEER